VLLGMHPIEGCIWLNKHCILITPTGNPHPPADMLTVLTSAALFSFLGDLFPCLSLASPPLRENR
jgi:hypothetical protein